jgi:hypothetical protein
MSRFCPGVWWRDSNIHLSFLCVYINMLIFLIGIVGGSSLSPLRTAATNRPIVPAPGVYDGEIGVMMIGRGSRSTRRKRAPVPLYPPQTLHILPGREPGPTRWKASDQRVELRPGQPTFLLASVKVSVFILSVLPQHRPAADVSHFISVPPGFPTPKSNVNCIFMFWCSLR